MASRHGSLLGLGEAGEIPGRHQERRRVVPEAGSRASDGYLQFRHERWCAGHTAGRAADRADLGWHWAFVIAGLLGFLWIGFWWPMDFPPEKHPRLTPAELAYIRSDPAEAITPVPLSSLFKHRGALGVRDRQVHDGPGVVVYLFWIPDFLSRNYGIDLAHMGLPLVIIYQVASVGSIGGGWLSSSLIVARLDRERGAQDGNARSAHCS